MGGSAKSMIPGMGGGENSQGKYVLKQGAITGGATPHLFDASQKYMPSNYFGNEASYDPSSILNAYMQHLPEFMQATKAEVTRAPSYYKYEKPHSSGGVIMDMLNPMKMMPQPPNPMQMLSNQQSHMPQPPMMPSTGTGSSTTKSMTQLFPNLFPSIFNH